MERPIRENFIEPDEAPDGTILGYFDTDEYIDALESYITFLETLKNLPNESKTVNRNEQKEKVCCICGATKFRDKNIICNKCKDNR